jgi:micrococcal nuclease
MKLPTFQLTFFSLCCLKKKQSHQLEELLSVTVKDTKPFTFPLTEGKVLKVYDGDTITIASKLPYDASPFYRFSVRLAGIDSPEIKGKTEHEKKMAIDSRDALDKLINGKIVRLENIKSEKYGRVLAEVYLNDLNVNNWMLNKCFAVKYYGGKKSEW